MFFSITLPIMLGLLFAYLGISDMFKQTTIPMVSRRSYYLTQTQPYVLISAGGQALAGLGLVAVIIMNYRELSNWPAATAAGVGIFLKALGGLLDPKLEHHGEKALPLPIALRQRITLGLIYAFLGIMISSMFMGFK